ncbi:MAG TPA: hypothetical protein VI603_03470 [Saprospiraceae bacterium]|nr:hypothetical protein [Saprospiraceae bacterium]
MNRVKKTPVAILITTIVVFLILLLLYIRLDSMMVFTSGSVMSILLLIAFGALVYGIFRLISALIK